jgi:hypothetical protein
MAMRKKVKSVALAEKLEALPVTNVPIAVVKPHPRNYRSHPEDQLEHLKRSIVEHGFYKNVVVANDLTILAGHGAVKAARELGFLSIPVVKLNIGPSDPRALKVLAGDNEIEHLAEQDDRLLSELLKIVKEDGGLIGTGFDEQMLANLVYVTRPAAEIADHNEAAHWVGMPDYELPLAPHKVIVSFRSLEDKMKFAALIGQKFTDKTVSTWWPYKEKNDVASVRFEPAMASKAAKAEKVAAELDVAESDQR